MPPAPKMSGSTSKAAASVAAGARQRVERLLLASARREGNARDVEEQRLVRRVEGRARAGRHRADRIAVIAVLERDDARARSPRLRQKPSAILIATSTQVEPLSE